uniref:MSP domain-containing protein n=1 Tax=Rhabditophanes sp. KR3021 TaxID=114890 RepID=A0AC35TPW4_9BILA
MMNKMSECSTNITIPNPNLMAGMAPQPQTKPSCLLSPKVKLLNPSLETSISLPQANLLSSKTVTFNFSPQSQATGGEM